MPSFASYSGTEPVGTIVVRLVPGPDGPRGFIRQVSDPHDIAQDSIEPSEEMPVEEALALAHNKAANIEGGAGIVIELEPDVDWDPSWGRLD